MSETKFSPHGGDIYNNRIELDFSVGTNPLADELPAEIKDAAIRSIEKAHQYPDIHYRKLTEAIARLDGVSSEEILCGNGSSELFGAISRALHPKKVLLLVPCFSGYEWSLGMDSDCKISKVMLHQSTGFSLDFSILSYLTKDIDMLFVAHPNNPTGRLINEDLLDEIFLQCQKKSIVPVVDVCYYAFCGEKPLSDLMAEAREICSKVIFVNAFTKILSIPGIRLGYLWTPDSNQCAAIRRCLPEWNVSGVASEVGVACANILQNGEFLKQTVQYISREKQWLSDELKTLGIQVYESDANFFLAKKSANLYKELIERNILIRSCYNFDGLGKEYVRIAVKSHEKNEWLVRTIAEILEQ